MTANEIEATQLRRLQAEIQADLGTLAEIVARVKAAMECLGDPSDPDRATALAAYLHHWYTGVETIHQRIAQLLEGAVPTGRSWRRDLLQEMALGIPDVRPTVISQETVRELADYLGFRHVFRHAYALVLDVERLKLLSNRLPEISRRYRQEMVVFLDYLRSCIDECDAVRWAMLLALLLLNIALPTHAENLFLRADHQAFDWMYGDLHTERLEQVFKAITYAGDPKFLLGSSLLWGTYGNPSRAEAGKLWATAVGSTGLVTYGLKHLFGRDRPLEVDSSSPAFPSGHTSLAFVSATVLGAEYPRLQVPFYALATLVGFSRVYLGRHYPSDVLAGVGLGIAMGYLTHRHRGYLLRLEF